MDSTRKTFVLLSFWFLLLSCATPQHERFTKLKIGVDKTQALDIVGSPNFSERRNGQDEWTYVYYKNNERLSKRLFFQKDTLVAIEDLNLDSSLQQQVNSADSLREYENKIKAQRKENNSGFEALDQD